VATVRRHHSLKTHVATVRRHHSLNFAKKLIFAELGQSLGKNLIREKKAREMSLENVPFVGTIRSCMHRDQMSL
jgi:hypothetical protein